MEKWKVAEIIAEMLEVSNLLPVDAKVETQPYKDYLFLEISGKKYRVSLEEEIAEDLKKSSVFTNY